MLTFSRVMLLTFCVVLLATGCRRKQEERERQTAQLQTISKRLDEIQANLAVMSETRTETVYHNTPPAAPMVTTSPVVTLTPESSESSTTMVQITDFSKAEPLSRKEQVSRLGQRAPTSQVTRHTVTRKTTVRTSKAKYGKVIAVSGLSAVDLQKALKNAGFNPGKVDGKIGPNTVKAIKQFQTAEGLSADGVVGRRTWAKLSPHLAGPAAAPAAPAAETAPVVNQDSFNVF